MMPDISHNPAADTNKAFRGPQRAVIYQVDQKGNPIDERDFPPVKCMFNPAEYAVSMTNTYQEKHSTEANGPTAHFTAVGPHSLTLNLTFDSYEAGTDVRTLTGGLWKFMRTKKVPNKSNGTKDIPIRIAFEWGSFFFVGFITSLSQTLTLFTQDGVPVRAKVQSTFVQYTNIEEPEPTNPTSGGGPIDRTWKVVAGDRLDSIAAQVYNDATQWRKIAEHNHLTNPLALRPGQVLQIPIA